MWCKKAEKNDLHVKKNVFFLLYNDLGKMKLSVEKNIIFFCYTPYFKVSPISFQEQVLFLF